jgi:Ca-activated chloride channel family protein
MMEFLQQFHFLRPWFLLLIIPFGWFCYLIFIRHSQDSGLEKLIDQHLLVHLTKGKIRSHGKQYLPTLGLCLIWLIVIIALAGPTWKKQAQPLYESEAAVVLILDLSPSMRAEDIKPSRIQRAHLKILDVLAERKGGLNALIVYGGEAHVVTPLTNDTDTLVNLLPSLVPGILPIPGSNVEMAIDVALDTIEAAGLTRASFFLVTDGIDTNAISTIKRKLVNNIDLTILGIGTEAGAPIPIKDGFIKDNNGNTIIAKRNSDVLQELADLTNGHYLPLQADNSDVIFFNKKVQQQQQLAVERDAQSRNSDIWFEFGPTLLLLIIPLLALSFRRGWLLQVTFVGTIFTSAVPEVAHASLWDKLWKNSDQRGLSAWQQEDYATAAKEFNNEQWQGSAEYKNKNYEEALNQFRQDNSATGLYNQGNALAQLGNLDEAISAYNQALSLKPEFPEAKKNKKLLEDLKKEQQNQQNNQQDNQQDNNNSDNQQNSDQENDKSDNANNEQNQDSSNQDNNQQAKDSGQQQQDKQESSSNTDEQQNQEQKDQKQQTQTKEQDKGSEERNSEEKESLAQANSGLSEEEQQALQQWLRKVPDDPSGLLRRKFQYEFQKRRQLYQQGEWKLPENNAHKRY